MKNAVEREEAIEPFYRTNCKVSKIVALLVPIKVRMVENSVADSMRATSRYDTEWDRARRKSALKVVRL